MHTIAIMTEEEINNTLGDVAGAIFEEPVEITVDVVPSGRLHSLLMRIGLAPMVRTFHIKPMCLGTRMLISRELLAIHEYKEDSSILVNHMLSADHTDRMARVIALAILNRNEKPSKSLVDFILRSFTPADQAKVAMVILRQLNISDFVSSTAWIRGAGLLKSQEIIAGQKKTKDQSIPGPSPEA